MITPYLTPKIIETFKLTEQGFNGDGFYRDLPTFTNKEHTIYITAHGENKNGIGFSTIEKWNTLRLILRFKIDGRSMIKEYKMSAIDEDTIIEFVEFILEDNNIKI